HGHHLAAHRLACGDEVVEQSIRHLLVEDALIAEALEVEFQGLELDARFTGCVRERDCAEIRLTGLWADAGELGTDDLDGKFPARSRIRERLQLLGGRRLGRFHALHQYSLSRLTFPPLNTTPTFFKPFRALNSSNSTTAALTAPLGSTI